MAADKPMTKDEALVLNALALTIAAREQLLLLDAVREELGEERATELAARVDASHLDSDAFHETLAASMSRWYHGAEGIKKLWPAVVPTARETANDTQRTMRAFKFGPGGASSLTIGKLD